MSKYFMIMILCFFGFLMASPPFNPPADSPIEIFYGGKTFDFAEEDAISEIENRLHQNQERLEKRFLEMKDEAIKRLDELSPQLSPLPYAKENRYFYADTTYTHPEDIKDAQGRIIYPAGFTFDPMHFITLPYEIYVINATRDEEIAWIKERGVLGKGGVRILITQGNYKEVTKKLGQIIFFATETILKRLNITVTPSIATQEGNRLKIEEVALKEFGHE